MYWYTKIKNSTLKATLVTLGIANLIFSCTSSQPHSSEVNIVQYIDIPLYFQKQIDEFHRTNPLVVKTVISNNDKETKELHIKDWSVELSPFLTVDLNKPAYQSYISKDSTNNIVTYSLNGKNIDSTKVTIVYKDSIITSFTIERNTKNILYKTDEKLVFENGKYYSINKTQKVLLVGNNEYSISGVVQ